MKRRIFGFIIFEKTLFGHLGNHTQARRDSHPVDAGPGHTYLSTTRGASRPGGCSDGTRVRWGV